MPAFLLPLVFGVYVVAGVLSALGVLGRGLERIDLSACGAPYGFKVMVFPGLVALWPLFVLRWLHGSGHPPEENNAHRRMTATINREANR